MVGSTSGTHVTPAAFRATLTGSSSAGWTLFDHGSGSQLSFTGAGRLATVNDRNGNTTVGDLTAGAGLPLLTAGALALVYAPAYLIPGHPDVRAALRLLCACSTSPPHPPGSSPPAPPPHHPPPCPTWHRRGGSLTA